MVESDEIGQSVVGTTEPNAVWLDSSGKQITELIDAAGGKYHRMNFESKLVQMELHC